jgi:TatD-related deoxyribonuclease
MADKAGLARERLVRHYAPPDVSEKSTCGLIPSVLAGSGSIETIIETYSDSKHGFMLETDYMDDLKRPGAVLGPKTVPKRTRQLLEAGLDEEALSICHIDLPERIYGPI